GVWQHRFSALRRQLLLPRPRKGSSEDNEPRGTVSNFVHLGQEYGYRLGYRSWRPIIELSLELAQLRSEGIAWSLRLRYQADSRGQPHLAGSFPQIAFRIRWMGRQRLGAGRDL